MLRFKSSGWWQWWWWWWSWWWWSWWWCEDKEEEEEERRLTFISFLRWVVGDALSTVGCKNIKHTKFTVWCIYVFMTNTHTHTHTHTQSHTHGSLQPAWTNRRRLGSGVRRRGWRGVITSSWRITTTSCWSHMMTQGGDRVKWHHHKFIRYSYCLHLSCAYSPISNSSDMVLAGEQQPAASDRADQQHQLAQSVQVSVLINY